MKETELAEVAIAWLEEQGCKVYQEVPVGKGRADLVGKIGDKIHIVECKVSLTFDLFAQAIDRKPYGHWIWICVPQTQQVSSGRLLAYKYAQSQDIGVIEVSKTGSMRVRSEASINRYCTRSKEVISILTEEMNKMGKAGSPGTYWTPFKSTCAAIEQMVRPYENGMPLKDALKALGKNHHYSSDNIARSCLKEWALQNKIIGVDCYQVNGQWFLMSKHSSKGEHTYIPPPKPKRPKTSPKRRKKRK